MTHPPPHVPLGAARRGLTAALALAVSAPLLWGLALPGTGAGADDRAAPAALAAADPQPLEVGAPFPALELPTIQGDQRVSLEAFAGRKVLLLEFASW